LGSPWVNKGVVKRASSEVFVGFRFSQVYTNSVWDARIFIATFSINFIINTMTFFVIVNGYIVRRTTNICKWYNVWITYCFCIIINIVTINIVTINIVTINIVTII